MLCEGRRWRHVLVHANGCRNDGLDGDLQLALVVAALLFVLILLVVVLVLRLLRLRLLVLGDLVDERLRRLQIQQLLGLLELVFLLADLDVDGQLHRVLLEGRLLRGGGLRRLVLDLLFLLVVLLELILVGVFLRLRENVLDTSDTL